MNAITAPALTGLRAPFPPHQISKLPKETGAQAKQRKAAMDAGNWPSKCSVCGGFHHANAVHLDYVGHAALTDRLLDTDPAWTWEPVALTPDGLPAFDRNGGLWIKLTVNGVSRLGYGAADGKTGGDAIKEVIGDALRNAAMRFGAALDLWHKGDLHVEDAVDEPAPAPRHDPATPALITDEQRAQIMTLANSKNIDARTICEAGEIASIPQMLAVNFPRALAWLTKQPKRDLVNPQASAALADEIPY